MHFQKKQSYRSRQLKAKKLRDKGEGGFQRAAAPLLLATTVAAA
jgi:hypothetical protein